MIDKNCMCRNKLQVNFFLTHFKVSSSLLCSWLLKLLLIQNSLARGAPPQPPFARGVPILGGWPVPTLGDAPDKSNNVAHLS